MAYKIQYNPEENIRYPKIRKRKPVRWKRWFLSAAILAAILWVRQRGMPDFLILGDPEVTTAAVGNMIVNLQQGSSVNDAVTVFCREILHGAGF